MRKILFWSHLCVGVVAGLVILMMSVTGVLLTYERQIMSWAESAQVLSPPATTVTPLPPETLLARLHEQAPDFEPTALLWQQRETAPVVASAGRSGRHYLDPWTGDLVEPPGQRLDAFFSAVTGWHRWFNVAGDGRATARMITGASNIGFLFLILSGIYLWLPPVYRWMVFRTRLLFNPRVDNARARDYNWHHVFGIWIAVPLAIVVATATVFSYGWANNLVYRAFGEEPPTRSQPGSQSIPAVIEAADDADRAPLSLAELLIIAQAHDANWKTLNLDLPAASAKTVRFNIDTGNGGQPHKRYSIELDTRSGALLGKQDFDDNSAGRQARLIIRFLHTGEALGVAGQTLAGIVSLLSILMVWTGLALAWRRLVSPVLRRKKIQALAAASGNPDR